MPVDRLPPPYREPAERLAEFLSTDSGVMIILGLTFIYRGVSYWFLGDFILVNPIDTHLPREVSGGYWLVLGLALVVSSWRQSSMMSRCLLALGVMTLTLWGCVFIFSTPGTFNQRGSIYLGFAVVVVWSVWRGRRGEIRVRKELPDADIPGG